MEERKPEYQGRTQKQQDSNEAVGAMSVIALVATAVGVGVYQLIMWLVSK